MVGAQGLECADEGVLDDLLGIVMGAAEELAGVGVQPSLVALVDRGECAVVAGADQIDELLVGGGAVGGRVEQDRRHAIQRAPRGAPLPATPGGRCRPPRWRPLHPGVP